MRGIKALVTVMTVLIVICLGLVIYGFSRTMSEGHVAEAKTVSLPTRGDIRGVSGDARRLVIDTVEKGKTTVYFADTKTGAIKNIVTIVKTSPEK